MSTSVSMGSADNTQLRSTGASVEGQPIYVLETIQDVCEYVARTAPEEPPTMQRTTRQRERAHREGKLTNPLNGVQAVFAFLGYQDIRTLEGRLLTIVDATFGDPQQRKAFKDLVRKEIWFNWVRYLDTDEPHGGMPDLR